MGGHSPNLNSGAVQATELCTRKARTLSCMRGWRCLLSPGANPLCGALVAEPLLPRGQGAEILRRLREGQSPRLTAAPAQESLAKPHWDSQMKCVGSNGAKGSSKVWILTATAHCYRGGGLLGDCPFVVEEGGLRRPGKNFSR